MKIQHIAYGAAIVGCISLGSLAALGYLAVQKVHAQANLPAYTLSQVERVVAPDGAEKYRIVRTTAVRSDGSKAVKELRHYKSNGAAWQMPVTNIYDVSNERLTSYFPRVKGKMSGQLNPIAIGRLKTAVANCEKPGYELKPEAAPVGFFGARIRSTAKKTGSDESMTTDEKQWVLPELNCVVLQEESITKGPNGELRGTRYLDFVSLTPGEPDPALFAIPSDYVEMTPSQVMLAQNKQEGKDCRECEKNLLEHADRNYFANLPKKP